MSLLTACFHEQDKKVGMHHPDQRTETERQLTNNTLFTISNDFAIWTVLVSQTDIYSCSKLGREIPLCEDYITLIIVGYLYDAMLNSPLLSSGLPLCQNDSKCETILMKICFTYKFSCKSNSFSYENMARKTFLSLVKPLPFIKGVGKYTCASSQRWFKDIVKCICDSLQRYGKGCPRASFSPLVSCKRRVSRSPRVSRNPRYSSSALCAPRKRRNKPLGLKAMQG